MVATDPYSWWRNALNGSIGKMTETPEAGFYRTKLTKDGTWVPVAIWWETPHDADGVILGDDFARLQIGFDPQDVDPDQIGQRWINSAKNPITEDEWLYATKHKQWRPHPAERLGKQPEKQENVVAASLVAAEQAKQAPAPIGHNLPDDPFEAMKLELENEIETVTVALLTQVTTQEQADKIGPWTKRIATLMKRAVDAHDLEKAPHLAACRAVDDKWRTVAEGARDLVIKLKTHLEPFLIQQKRAEEARAADAARLAEELRKQAETSPLGHQAMLREADELERQAEVRQVAAGRPGAKVTLKVEKHAKVVDYLVCVTELLKHGNETITAAIDVVAERALRSGTTLPGVEVVTTEKAVRK